MAVYGDRIQALMDEVYSEWQKEENKSKGKWDILNGFSEAHQIAVTFGNFNYQVENGGIEQWIYNGYFHEDTEKFAEHLETGAKFDERCQTILDSIYTLEQHARETDCDRDGSYISPYDEDGERRFISDMIDCDAFDSWYYEHCGKDDWWEAVCGVIDKMESLEIKPAHQNEEKCEDVTVPPSIQVYIENARDSKIGGFTIPLPTTRETLAPWLAAIEVSADDSDSIVVKEIRSDIPGLESALGNEAPSLDELNYLAVRMCALDPGSISKFAAALESNRYHGSIRKIINLTENLDCIDLQPAYSEKQYGEFLVQMGKDDTAEAFERLEKSGNSDDRALAAHIMNLESYVDEAALGQAVALQEKGIFTEHGYMTGFTELNDIYHGRQDIPPEYRLFNARERQLTDMPHREDDRLLAAEDCAPGGMDADIKGKVVAIKPEVLLPEYQTRSHQLILATGGFGCSSNARGRAVFGTNLYSGEQARWERSDILGVIDEDTLSKWERDKLFKVYEPAKKESVVARIREMKIKPPEECKTKPHNKTGPEL